MSNLPPGWNQFDNHMAGLGTARYTPNRAKIKPYVRCKNPITWEQMCKNQEFAYDNGLIEDYEL